MPERLLTSTDIADIIGRKPVTIRKAFSTGRLPISDFIMRPRLAAHAMRAWRTTNPELLSFFASYGISGADVEEWMSEHRIE